MVANKIDLIKEVDEDLKAKAEDYAKMNNLGHMEASAKSGKNVNEVFVELRVRIKNETGQSRTAALSRANRPNSARADSE